MKRKIILEGEIGEKFGREFTINADSFKDVVQCLNGNFPEFQKYLIEADERNIGFTCHVGEAPITDERELFLNYPEGAMIISALPAGSKSAGAKILAAVAIIAVSFMIPGGPFALFNLSATATLGTKVLAYTAFFAFNVGVNLALSGLQQMMAPDPSTDSGAQQDESYLFQGTGQEAIEGDPVPIIYGKLRVPGRPISSQIKNERQAFINIGSGTSPATPSTQENNPAGIIPPAQYSLGLGQSQRYYGKEEE